MTTPRALLLLFLLCLPLFIFRLGDRDLTSSHEARAAQHAQMMLTTGDWGLPTLFNRRVDLQKPPLFYWLVACVGWLRGGVDPWAVRLPAAISAFGCVLATFFLALRLRGPRAGFLAALILATSLHFTWLARVGRTDMPLTFALTLASVGHVLGCLARENGGRGLGWFLMSAVALAAGILIKGPLALVLFLIWQLAFWFCFRTSRVSDSSSPEGTPTRTPGQTLTSPRGRGGPRRLGPPYWGYPLALAIALPWFLWANEQTGHRLWEVFFLHHNLERGLGSAETLASHPFWYYGPRLAIDLLPWSLFLPWLAWRLLKRGHGSLVEDARGAGARLGMVWFAGFVVFFSLMSFKRSDYLLPAFPGFALALGALLDRELLHLTKRARGQLAIPCLAVAVALGWLIHLQWLDRETREGWVIQREARDIRQRTTMPVIFFRTEAHALAFHVGRPLDTILEWENLDVWASRSEEIFFVMPPDCAAVWRDHLQASRLVEVASFRDEGKRPLVLLKSVP